MTGTVSASLEPRLPLRLRDVHGVEHVVEAVLDTGFDGELVLPEDLIEALGAPWAEARYGRLADGTEILTDIYEVDLEWNGVWTTAFAEALPSTLVGVSLCAGLGLTVDFVPGGSVRLSPLP